MKNRDLIREAAEQYRRNNFIDPALYKTNGVKRGLREPDGTGVVAGVTLIGNVVGYEKTGEGVIPCEGHLTYRGYDLYDLVDGFWERERFGFEEISFLLLFGFLQGQFFFLVDKYLSIFLFLFEFNMITCSFVILS